MVVGVMEEAAMEVVMVEETAVVTVVATVVAMEAAKWWR